MSTRVLVVDDDPSVRRMLQLTYEYAGFSAAIAANGADALRLMEGEAFDLVVMDVVMPVMSGIEATRRILARWTEARIIACSTVDHAAVVQQACEFRRLLGKPPGNVVEGEAAGKGAGPGHGQQHLHSGDAAP